MTAIRIVVVAALAAALALGVAVWPGPRRNHAEASAERDPRTDVGTGERLLVLVAGEFATRAQAEAAEARLRFGDLAGFVVARRDDFAGMTPGRFLLVTAFRTLAGAGEFEPLARAAGATVRRVVTIYTGREWIGLGQEANPDGSGPLLGPLPPGHPSRL